MDGLKIPIRHCSEQSFLDLFRADLAGGGDHVIILSPFLSQNRAAHYYPVLLTLISRHVSVDVYARPKSGQPESLRDHFDQVEQGLRRIGARLHLRPGMHEKMGVIDGRILWHGSLNILSHNNTKESMIRFESPDLTQEVLCDLGISPIPSLQGDSDLATSGESFPEDGAEGVPKCPNCGKYMLHFEQARLWICQDSPSCQGTLLSSITRSADTPIEDESLSQQLELHCPICDSLMAIRRGLFTRVICSAPDCDFALDRKLATGILRILKRRKVV
jgi:hypothetical protein